MGYDAVGIRLRSGDDFPYFMQHGFSSDFLVTENSLVVRNQDGGLCRGEDGCASLECTCGLVISGKADPANPLFTAGGSAWVNNSLPLLDLPPDQDPRLHPRNRCIHEGYLSVALIPIRVKQDIVGLLQLNDRRENCFTLYLIHFFEEICEKIGAALMQKQADEALRQSEYWLRESQRVSRVGSYVMDVRSGSWTSTAALDDIFGIGQDYEKSVESWGRILHPEDRQTMLEYFRDEVLGHKQVFNRDYRIVRQSDGAVRWVHGHGQLYFDASGTTDRMAGTIQDITERKLAEDELKALNAQLRSTNEQLEATNEEMAATSQELYATNDELVRAEQAMRESEARFRAVVEQAGDGFELLDEDGLYVNVNVVTCAQTGYDREELIGKSILEVDPQLTLERYQTIFRGLMGNPPITFESVYRRKDGSEFPVEVTASVITLGSTNRAVSLVRDITERKRAEAERAAFEEYLRQSQKMEAIGVLAGGIAHDFNNLLFAILGYGDLILSSLEQGSMNYDNMQAVIAAGNRAKGLVQQILTFSRKTKTEQVPLDLRVYVNEVGKLMRAMLPSTIEIKQSIETDAAVVMADPTEIHQVLMNFCTNAAHAIGDSKGVMEISLRETEVSSEFTVQHKIKLTPGTYLELSVNDTGAGIPPEIQQRILEPFFTTKPKGKGTGMGLSVVHGIVMRLGGEILVESKVGEGSRFTVYLPAFRGTSDAKGTEIAKPPSGSARILVVDDEADILTMLDRSLTSLGYQVRCCNTGQEALTLLGQEPQHFEVLITDQTMPQMTGIELAQQVLKMQPGLPVILCTGFSEAITPETASSLGLAGLMYKPVLIADLARAINSALQPQA